MTLSGTLIVALHYVGLTVLVLFGVHRLYLTALYRRRGEEPAAERLDERALPFVTVQLPMYNERLVASRVIRAAAALDYPRDRLQIQVLDDSTDATVALVDDLCARLAADGIDIAVVRRASREGYKAGALANGLNTARGSLVAIFDADFVPPESFLRDLVGHFSDSAVGMVQARWGHLNAQSNLLTRAQSAVLDGHFVVEQCARARAGHFFNFNGTAGIWRRAAIDDAGGWQHDTITEDLDISYRAQLAGWRFVYRSDVVAPAELPATLDALRSQQHRWAKGSTECLLKLASSVARARVPVSTRVEAFVHLTANTAYLWMVAVALTMPFVIGVRHQPNAPDFMFVDLSLLVLGASSVSAFYYVASRRTGSTRLGAALAVPLAITLDLGLSLHKARAVLEALAGHRTEFVRTPKQALVRQKRRAALDLGLARSLRAGVGELALAAWLLTGTATIAAALYPSLVSGFFLVMFTTAYLFIAWTALAQGLPSRFAIPRPEPAVADTAQ